MFSLFTPPSSIPNINTIEKAAKISATIVEIKPIPLFLTLET